MKSIFEKITNQYRFIFVIILFLLLVGTGTFISIPKEANPDVKVPVIYTSITMRGISPEDGERLILRPLEKKLKGLENVKKIQSKAFNGFVSVSIEFDAGFNSSIALSRVKDKVDEVKPELPKGIEQPVIKEFDYSKFPVLNVILYGDITEDELIKNGRYLKSKIESVKNVLEVKLIGNKKDIIEITVHPSFFEKYKIGQEISQISEMNNNLIPAGFYSNQNASFSVNIESLVKSIDDVKEIPIISKDGSFIKLKDIGRIKKSYLDPEYKAKFNGKPAVVLEISKRYGTNIIETIESVKNVIENEKKSISQNISIELSRDRSEDIKESLSDLGNNIIFAIILVVIVVISQLGKKQGILISLSIPLSFFISIMIINFLGFTLNMVVLFSLVLASGMIVDASVIVVEYADRLINQGEDFKSAYAKGSSRMSIPVLSATIGIIIVYMPLLFWPGVIGQFMKFLPITIISVLSSSLLCALIFIPVLGRMFGNSTTSDKLRYKKENEFLEISEKGDLLTLNGFIGKYIKILNKLLNKPKLFVVVIIISFFISIFAYQFLGNGLEFFPNIEPSNMQVVVHSGGNLSIDKKEEIILEIEQLVSKSKENIKSMYTKIYGDVGVLSSNYQDDVIGVIDLELSDWNKRPKAENIKYEIQKNTEGYIGAKIDILTEGSGPRSGEKKIQIEILSVSKEKAIEVSDKIFNFLEQDKKIIDLESSLPSRKIKWKLDFNKSLAMKYGIDVISFGNIVKMCTNGMKITSFRPDYAEDSVDVLLLFDKKYRNIKELPNISIYKNGNPIKINEFAKVKPDLDTSIIKKIDGKIAVTLSSNVKNNTNINNKIIQIQNWIEDQKFDKEINIKFAGESEDKKETGSFLLKAFTIAIFLKIAILIAQFNSIYYSLVVMSAVILSTMGVLIGLVLTGKSFGIVMCGLGIISLAGIVVSNNIILIDTYQKFIYEKIEIREAILRTVCQRIRPILMTSATTIMGLIPMIFNITIDFFNFRIIYNSPSGQWWEQLSVTIGGGLFFATIFTLFLTPCILMIHTPKNSV